MGALPAGPRDGASDRKSTRLNSSHSQISYAVFCLKKKQRGQAQITDVSDPRPPPAGLRGTSVQIHGETHRDISYTTWPNRCTSARIPLSPPSRSTH